MSISFPRSISANIAVLDQSENTRGVVSDPSSRGTFNIFTTCISILILCAWTSIHVNITKDMFRKKVAYALLTIFAPEVTLTVAIVEFISVWREVQKCNALLQRPSALSTLTAHSKCCDCMCGLLQPLCRMWQWFTSPAVRLYRSVMGWLRSKGVIIQEQDDPQSQRERWTLLEGFYAWMKGFVVVWEHNDEEVVTLERLTRVDKGDLIDSAPTYAPEIHDKSKVDQLSKIITLIQAIWFVLQCCARAAEDLPLSILELGTLGYVGVTGVLYCIWMFKPKDIRTPTRIRGRCSKPPPEYSPNRADKPPSNDSVNRVRPEGGLTEADPENAERTLPLLDRESIQNHLRRATHRPLQTSAGDSPDLESSGPWSQPVGNRNHAKKSLMHRLLFMSETVGPIFWLYLWDTSAQSPSEGDMAMGFKSDKDIGKLASTVYVVVCASFGAWHCIAWNSYFPSGIERLLWRITSLLSALPGIILWVVWKINTHSFLSKKWTTKRVGEGASMMLMLIWMCLYLCARGFLILEMFLSLRRMPDGVFETINWTNLIPHI
ncbi:hypothetical protein CERSUDRAFT_100803 [Gelatoporia subvermispora B]|uniref:Uncharacterized protein n=1 Tax=Ceriporiopsis subvermispora (strain B) TaxID=914234 RepID=M2QYL1_CERS8|nr:hypothetical protein CERSUDRAFT_100803 [Gelatoporia subvermispora B]